MISFSKSAKRVGDSLLEQRKVMPLALQTQAADQSAICLQSSRQNHPGNGRWQGWQCGRMPCLKQSAQNRRKVFVTTDGTLQVLRRATFLKYLGLCCAGMICPPWTKVDVSSRLVDFHKGRPFAQKGCEYLTWL